MGLLSQVHAGRASMPPRLMVYGTEGIGKAQPLDAKVLMPRGFVTMAEVKVGDQVIGSDGKAHHVIGVYPQGPKEVYRVTFRDGSATECCDDHLWFTQTRGERDRGLAGAVRSLRDIRKTLRYGTHFNHSVPRVRPVEFQATEIRDVEYVGLKPCQCIRIDAPDSLYVTDDFLLTHNSTLAARTPKPIFIQTEDGLGEIDCHKFPLARSLDDVLAALAELNDEPHDYQTVVIDSLDWLERMIWDVLCKHYGVASIEKVDGGYGKGYVHAMTQWRQVVDRLALLRSQRNMMVVLVAHAKVERFEDPEEAAYDRYSPRLNKHAAALIAEWCDGVLFATRKIVTRTETGAFNRTRTKAAPVGKDGGERILRCIGGPSCIAKNRYGLPSELPLDWDALAAGLFRDANINPSPTE